MNLLQKSLAAVFLSFLVTACTNDKKEKELAKKEEELNKREQALAGNLSRPSRPKISLAAAVKLAEKKFEKHLPKILQVHDAAIDLQEASTGDFTGDGLEDVAIYFSLSPKGGGNALVGQGLALYKNTGYGVEILAGYEPDYLFSFEKISEGKIHVNQLKYADGDGRCCPSIQTKHTLTITGNKVY